MKIYGPYLRKDGRQHIVIVHSDGKKQTQSYPRYLMEQHLGRNLLDSETVDHINGDYTDDRIENLQILTLKENVQKAWNDGTFAPKEWYKGLCGICGNEFTKPMNQVRHNLNQGKKGPFCSRKCGGKASHL